MRLATTGRRLLIMALCVIVAAPYPPTIAVAAVTAPAAGYGFGDGAATDAMSITDLNRELDAVSETGASWLRILVDWNQIEPRQGQYEWSHLDSVVDAARQHNLAPLAIIAYTAAWARPPGSSFTAFPLDPANYGRFAAAVVTRYGAQISHWQLWNEPNLPLFSGNTTLTGARYTELLRAAYPAIKAVQPDSTVVAAGLSRKLGDDSPPAYMAQLYAAGAKGYFDAAAVHPYVFPGGFGADTENGWSDVSRLHDVMIANGDGERKIWFTEFGVPTNALSCGGATQAQQAEQIAAILDAAATSPYAGPVFIYSIRDIATSDGCDRETNFGALLTTEWQPKAAARLLSR
jgi:polysaccharide biosynthesis protein PslG